MVQLLGERKEHREIGRSLKIQNPALQFRLVQMIDRILSQPLSDLGTAIIDAMGTTDESNERILSRRFL